MDSTDLNKITNEELKKSLRWVLNELEKEAMATPHGQLVYFEYRKTESGPSFEDQRRGIMYLHNNGHIKIHHDKYPLGFTAFTAEIAGAKSLGTYVEVLNTEVVQSRKPSFDKEKSILHFHGKDILISNSKNTNPHYLMCVIFPKMKELACDEIWESEYFGGPDEMYDSKKHWKKIHNSATQVNNKVEKATGIKDFLKVTMTSVSVNDIS